jgi:hypothetical protein
MTTMTPAPTAVVLDEQKSPACEPQRGACVEFVKFCKEQHLNSRAAHTFLHVLHNKTWEAECDTIRESMRPEVDRIFGPAEKALNDGVNCKEVLATLVRSLKEAEELK